VAQLDDLRFVAIVQVLPRAENFHCRNARALNAVKHRHRKAVIDEQVR
jgi:hypothetical protein